MPVEPEDWLRSPAVTSGTYLFVSDDAAMIRDFRKLLSEAVPEARLKTRDRLDGLENILKDPVLDFTAVLIDQALAKQAGGEGIRHLSGMPGCPPLLLFAGSDRNEDVLDGLRMGCGGYILKSGGAEVLKHALGLAVHDDGLATMPAGILKASLQPDSIPDQQPLADQLTDRQQDVFDLLLSGKSNKEIARDLGVLEGTVKVHVRAIMQKLGARNRTQVAVLAARRGLLKTPAVRA